MDQLTNNTQATTDTIEEKATNELLKIIAFGSVFPLIYLLGKLITQL